MISLAGAIPTRSSVMDHELPLSYYSRSGSLQGSSLNGLDLSTAVLGKGGAEKIIADGIDQFIRKTEGGKIVQQKLSVATLIPYAIAGLILGIIIGRASK